MIATGGAFGSLSRWIRCGVPSTGTMAPSINATGRGKASSRAAIQPRCARKKRNPCSAGTPYGRTNSIARSAASIRNSSRRARG